MTEDTEIRKKKFELLPNFIKVYMAIPSILIDGVIVFLVAFLTTLATAFSGEEAYKYVPALLLFWLKCSIGALASGLVAVQSFRNKVYAEHIARQQQSAAKPNE